MINDSQHLEWSLDPESPYFKSLSPSVQQRITCEREIICAIAQAAIDRGFSVSVDNGETFDTGQRVLSALDALFLRLKVERTQSVKAVFDALSTTDEDYIYIHEAGGEPVGYFYCVYGNNGWDVISDYAWIDTAERNTQSVMDELDAAGTAVAEKWEAIL